MNISYANSSLSLSLSQLSNKWNRNKDEYCRQEVGDGLQEFIENCLSSELFAFLKPTEAHEQIEKTENKYKKEARRKGRRADFVISINSKILIPVEVEKTGNIKAGLGQIENYKKDWNTKYGLLTDGEYWCFYIDNHIYQTFNIDTLLNKADEFKLFWKQYTEYENYYILALNHKTKQGLFQEPSDIRTNEDLFFDKTTFLITTIANNISVEVPNIKQVREIAYSYLIQFILIKVLVDNKIEPFLTKYNTLINYIPANIHINSAKTKIFGMIEDLSNEIQKNIYKPFSKEQNYIQNKLIELLYNTEEKLIDIAMWLDITVYINDFNFANVENDIFGDIYENFLKTQYGNDLGQFFTHKAVVKYMLQEIGYTTEYVKDCINNNKLDKLSIIDPSCGSGTFLYSATDIIVKAIKELDKTDEEKAKLIEEIVNNNVFGLDVEEFSLYLAEMSILLRLLPFIYNQNYKNPLEKKLKLFKTKDSIAEFIEIETSDRNTGKYADGGKIMLRTGYTGLGYKSFMRDEEDVKELKTSIVPPKRRFDFVIGNPPYVSYHECCANLHLLFTQMIREQKIRMNNIYGINLHSIPDNIKKYAPQPNLYAFFIALANGLLKDNSIMSYIIPQTLLPNATMDVIRYYFSKEMTIEKLIIFAGKMFVGRGVEKKSEVATSSMIFVVRKQKPTAEHKVKIINYKNNDEIEKVFNSTKDEFEVLQSELLENVENWYYITKSKKDVEFLNKYNKNDEDISQYYIHQKAERIFHSKFYFDASFVWQNNAPISDVENTRTYNIPIIDKNYFGIQKSNNFIQQNFLIVPAGSQGFLVYQQKYKIICSKFNMNNYGDFHFTDLEKIMPKNCFVITSNNKNEILYLFSLLKSKINKTILQINRGVQNERHLQISITDIKQFIRVPKLDTQEQQDRKQKIIELTEEMLNCEKQEQVDFAKRDQLKSQIDNIVAKMYGFSDKSC